MNSYEEKQLFEKHGWEYNYIKRLWTSPDGKATISTDQLVQYIETREMEAQLVEIVRQYGVQR